MRPSPPPLPMRSRTVRPRESSAGLRASLGANLVLLALVAVQLWRAPRESSPASVTVVAPTTRAAAVPHEARVEDVRPKAGGPELTPAAVVELERAGISDDAIAEGLIDDHTYRYDKRVRALEKKYAPKPVPRREMLAVAREGEAERTRELKAALGEEGYAAWDKEKTLDRLNMGGVRMSAEETDRAYRLQKDFDEKAKALQMAQEDGITDPADAQTLYNQAQQKLDSDLKSLLGKDRVAGLHGAPDPVADASRRFQDLNPTPEQAQAVVQAEADTHAREAALVQRLKENPAEAANLAAELKTLTDAREQNLRQIFGADNYEAAKRQNDSTYQKLNQYAGAWDISDNQIQPVYDALNAFHDQAERTRMAAEMSEAAGKPVNWHDINAGIEQSRLQTEAALAAMIGGERVRRLQQNGMIDVR